MVYTFRPARSDDVPSITEWTTDTFSWGDYVPERLPQWLESDASGVLVAVDEVDRPVGVAHVTQLSASEGWIEGARIHPDHRRKGLGTALNHAGVAWAAARGVRVLRLATEVENEAATSQVASLGYRDVCRWVYGGIEVDRGHRAADQFRLRPAPGSDAAAAWLFWAASDLSRVGRDLVATGWQWRTARPDDITSAGGSSQLMQSAAGWVRVEQPEEDRLRTSWIAATPEDLLSLLDGLLDLAAERSVGNVTIMLPKTGWTSEAITRFGGEPKEISIYSKAI